MPQYKAVILIAGPQKGTRFRPLSLDLPKPLFLVAGIPIIQHHIEALAKVEDLRDVLLLGFYPAAEMAEFVHEMNRQFTTLNIRYFQEYTSLGTAGGLYHFRDQIRSGDPTAFFVLNGDVCADFPLSEMMDFHRELNPNPTVTLLATEATRQQSLNYGCVVEDSQTHSMLHYVEKPTTYISTLVNCGVYIFSMAIFDKLQQVFQKKQAAFNGNPTNGFDNHAESMWLEKDVFLNLAGTDEARVFVTNKWWSQTKTAGSAIYANRHYLNLYRTTHPERLAVNGGAVTNGCCEENTVAQSGPTIIGNVTIHPTATVHSSAVLGPNVSIAKNVTVGAGCRIKESIILGNSSIGDHSLVLYTVIGMNAKIGSWTRVEGTPNDPNPNKPFAKMDNLPLFNDEGKLNPSITIVGCHVVVPSEIILLNSVVLPHKQLSHSIKNEIVL